MEAKYNLNNTGKEVQEAIDNSLNKFPIQIENKANSSNVLLKDNEEPYTPTGTYNPATKGYVDSKQVVVGVGTTTTGEPGTQASVTNTGTPSAPVFSFTIPKGDKGETGAQGAQGIQGKDGAKGDAATIKIGTVTTGAPTSDATVSNVGTNTDAVFNFNIPRGEPGLPGKDGEAGTTNYTELNDKPTINGRELEGNLNTTDLNIQYSDLQGLPFIPTKTSDLSNDSGFVTQIPQYFFKSVESETDEDNLATAIQIVKLIDGGSRINVDYEVYLYTPSGQLQRGTAISVGEDDGKETWYYIYSDYLDVVASIPMGVTDKRDIAKKRQQVFMVKDSKTKTITRCGNKASTISIGRFLTAHQDLSGKQNKLIPGTNVEITKDNVINCLGTSNYIPDKRDLTTLPSGIYRVRYLYIPDIGLDKHYDDGEEVSLILLQSEPSLDNWKDIHIIVGGYFLTLDDENKILYYHDDASTQVSDLQLMYDFENNKWVVKRSDSIAFEDYVMEEASIYGVAPQVAYGRDISISDTSGVLDINSVYGAFHDTMIDRNGYICPYLYYNGVLTSRVYAKFKPLDSSFRINGSIIIKNQGTSSENINISIQVSNLNEDNTVDESNKVLVNLATATIPANTTVTVPIIYGLHNLYVESMTEVPMAWKVPAFKLAYSKDGNNTLEIGQIDLNIDYYRGLVDGTYPI